MNRNTLITTALVALAFFVGLITLSGFDAGEDRGWAGMAFLFLVGPSLLGVGFVSTLISFATKSQKFTGYSLTAMLMVAAWMAGILISG